MGKRSGWKFSLRIDLDNAAFHRLDHDEDRPPFDPSPELARILRDLADRIDRDEWSLWDTYPVLDINGNTVGHWETTDRQARKARKAARSAR